MYFYLRISNIYFHRTHSFLTLLLLCLYINQIKAASLHSKGALTKSNVIWIVMTFCFHRYIRTRMHLYLTSKQGCHQLNMKTCLFHKSIPHWHWHSIIFSFWFFDAKLLLLKNKYQRGIEVLSIPSTFKIYIFTCSLRCYWLPSSD